MGKLLNAPTTFKFLPENISIYINYVYDSRKLPTTYRVHVTKNK